MGLDMHLYAKNKNTGEATEVGYWRKANQIHNFFITDLAKGEDDCKPIPVTREDLINLRYECTRVLENRGLAPILLPRIRGCFFGSTAIDADYFEELEDTIGMISRVLSEYPQDEYTFYYRASW